MDTFFKRGEPLLLAHRGASGHAPENTLAAFARALEMRAEGIELDVQLSSDDHVVVLHDDTLPRTTNGEGAVAHLPWQELRRLDAGGWFAANFAGEPVPDLAQVLAMGPADWRLNIELKKSADPRRLVARVAELVGPHLPTGRIILTSFDPTILGLMAQILPLARLGLIFAHAWPDVNILHRWPVWSVEQSLLDKSQIARARKNNVKVCAWTANRVEEIERLLELGVDAVITNFPDRFHQAKMNLSARL
jgi:glycerophosphoryl diester phosphodiesterase